MALIQLGLKHSTLTDVVRAFGREADSTTVYARFLEGCSKVAEDRLDHALWRVFTAAGQDHRGVISLVELDLQLKELPGTGDILPVMREFLQLPPNIIAE